MARPRTPTNVLDARGAFKKNPQRARPDEPVASEAIGEAPAHLSEAQKACWNEIVSTAHEGVMCKADRLAVEIAAVLLNDFRTNAAEMPSAKLARLDSLLSRFGMTPADRSKVVAPKKQVENPFAALIAK